jgi:hypothetical protein
MMLPSKDAQDATVCSTASVARTEKQNIAQFSPNVASDNKKNLNLKM